MRAFVRALAAALVVGVSLSASAAPAGPWQLVFSDEFDHAGRPDPSKWTYDLGGGGWGNNELEYYTQSRANVRVENGRLVIEAHREPFKGYNYTSARIKTRTGGWTYGRFEIRAKMPHGSGTWPAIWMLPLKQTYGAEFWPDNGEIDIVEYWGKNPTNVEATYHMLNHYGSLGVTEIYPLTTAESEFHTYVVEWGPNVLKASVDGHVYNVYKNPHTDWGDWPFNEPFDIIMNLAIGGTADGKVGQVDNSIFPQSLQVEYVRVYQHAP